MPRVEGLHPELVQCVGGRPSPSPITANMSGSGVYSCPAPIIHEDDGHWGIRRRRGRSACSLGLAAGERETGRVGQWDSGTVRRGGASEHEDRKRRRNNRGFARGSGIIHRQARGRESLSAVSRVREGEGGGGRTRDAESLVAHSSSEKRQSQPLRTSCLPSTCAGGAGRAGQPRTVLVRFRFHLISIAQNFHVHFHFQVQSHSQTPAQPPTTRPRLTDHRIDFI